MPTPKSFFKKNTGYENLLRKCDNISIIYWGSLGKDQQCRDEKKRKKTLKKCKLITMTCLFAQYLCYCTVEHHGGRFLSVFVEYLRPIEAGNTSEDLEILFLK